MSAVNFDEKTSLKGQIKNLNEKLNDVNTLMLGLVFVLFIGFSAMFVGVAALLWGAVTGKEASYDDLKNQIITQTSEIKDQNSRIEVITAGLQKYKIIP